jgi:acyl transferase domain-containing protein/thioesterase domain-containing protein
MNSSAIAIIGMAGRFPGSPNVAQFWQNLKSGVESVRPFSDAELIAAGVSAEELAQPEYVKSGVVLEDLDMFDAAFFGFSPRDASIMDPQHRVFLECAWEALEDAGHAPCSFDGNIAVYAGSGLNSYMIHNLLTNPRLVASAGLFLIRQTGNDKDVLSTRVSYELNLHGPSLSVQTACSTSLVAVHLACQSLLNQECDIALAGGVTIEFPHGRGYLYREGEILSRDGHCRAFDADSSGTVFSSGAGIVVLRRFEDALAAGDTISAVILGSAINNDGSRKVGYLAPSVEGQAEVIAEALGVAGVAPGDISYVETHGTGTKVGDPIEIKALTQAFRLGTERKASCAIGSLKTNIGHLDTAAGIAGLIKTAQALKHRQIPPSLHYSMPNPLIDFENSPFFVNTALREWDAEHSPRRAGVTSLGIGGTNAHVVLEEAPQSVCRETNAKPYELLALSAKTASALERASQNLSAYLQEHRDMPLQDIAFTLQLGRTPFTHRRVLAAATTEDAAKLLAELRPNQVFSGEATTTPGVVFMFSGQGSQYVNMCRELYDTEPVFRSQLDRCADLLVPSLGLDLRTLLYPSEDGAAVAAQNLSHTRFTQPALFSIEYALAQWWRAHGVSPSAMIGHSIGEYVAACLAGVFSLEDGLATIAIRGRLIGEMPAGSMLSVAASADTLLLPDELALAAINGPDQCVVSGPTNRVQDFALELEAKGIPSRLLQTSHAFHSSMMDPMLAAFAAHMETVSLHEPTIPYVSNLTGTWIKAADATDPRYWTRHLRSTVRFSDGLAELFRDPTRLFLEVGPGQSLTTLTRHHSGRPKTSRVFPSTRHPQEKCSDAAFLLNTTGQLWNAGLPIEWRAFHAGRSSRRIPLPTYPFERQRYWIEPGGALPGENAGLGDSNVKAVPAEQWFHRRMWKRSPIEKKTSSRRECWLLFLDNTGLGAAVSAKLSASGHQVLEVTASDTYKHERAATYSVRPGVREDYGRMLKDILAAEHLPTHILHLWPIDGGNNPQRSLDQTLDMSFYSLLFLAQAWGYEDLGAVKIFCVSNGLQSVTGERVVAPARASLLGPIRCIPKEVPGVSCRSIDLDLNISDLNSVAKGVINECAMGGTDSCVAYRDSERWIEDVESITPRPANSGTRLRENGVYLIVGGLGGIGLAIAEHLARTVHARLVLLARTPVPPAAEWQTVLDNPNEVSDSRKAIAKLREIEALGSEILTVTADVTNPAQLADAMAVARQRFGDIHGVIHAAGLIDDGPLQIKSREAAARVLAPKVQGTLALHQALANEKVDFLLLFSSISSLAPPPGQVDYAAANSFLDAFALSQPGVPVTSVNWGLWSDIGISVADNFGILPLPVRRVRETPSETVYSMRLNCQTDWLVREHRYKGGDSLIPGTGYLQLAAAAVLRDRFELGVTFEDVFFLAPLIVAADESREVRVQLRRDGSAFHFSIQANGTGWTEYAAGQVARNQLPIPQDQNLERIRERCALRRIDFDDMHRTRQERYFEFGPRWQNLRTLNIGEREGLSELQLSRQFAADSEIWPIHPALLDLATGSALYLIEGYTEADALYLPISYKRITVYRPLPAHFYSHIRCLRETTTEHEVATFSFTLLDKTGGVLAEIDEFALRRMPDVPVTLASESPQRGAAIDSTTEDFSLAHRMSSAEAMKAFDQIVSSDVPRNVIVYRGSLSIRDAEPVASASPRSVTPGPQGEVEGVLAEWWQELLGVDDVGLDDDFFDLGGHSLVGVRLFAKIRKTYQVDLNLGVLFEARTISQLANVIRNSKKPTGVESRTWSALVPIQPKGSRVPLFCVHAQGVSVLFYEKLATHLGTDQPFYALQSPLVSKDHSRQPTIEELASLYVDELKHFFPQGPYYLGGASLGGLIAFEMSQQLIARGEKPGFLVLFDAIVPGSHQHVSTRGQLLRHWQNFREHGVTYLFERGLSKAEYQWTRLVRSTHRLQCSCYKLAHKSIPSSLRNFEAEEAHRKALDRYTVHFYPGKITLIRAANVRDTVATHRDSTLGWEAVAGGGLEIHDVPGGHSSIFEEPNVRILAKTLKTILPTRVPLES